MALTRLESGGSKGAGAEAAPARVLSVRLAATGGYGSTTSALVMTTASRGTSSK